MGQTPNDQLRSAGQRVDEDLAHYREMVIREGSKVFDERDLRENIEPVIFRMIQILFETERLENWAELIEEAARDCEVKEL